MRGWVFAVAAFLMILQPVAAAPICQGRDGSPMHCEAPGAMPLGWTAPAADRRVVDTDRREVWMAGGILLLLFALIALLPDFDGSQPKDWESDDRGKQ